VGGGEVALPVVLEGRVVGTGASVVTLPADEAAGAAVEAVVAGAAEEPLAAGADALADEAADEEPPLLGAGMVTPTEAQKDCAKVMVAAWSAAEQAVPMQAWTSLRKDVAVQMHLKSVNWQPVELIEERAQVCAHDGRPASD
jgi:hypothetical protein